MYYPMSDPVGRVYSNIVMLRSPKENVGNFSSLYLPCTLAYVIGMRLGLSMLGLGMRVLPLELKVQSVRVCPSSSIQ